MSTLLTFIVPVRHQANARHWPELKQRLAQTLASIASQDHADWRGIVVANWGADLPEMPAGFEVERVDFAPNTLHELGNATKEQFYEAFRLDKGRRVLAGMRRASDSTYFMISDDDDFVSRKLTGFVAEHRGDPGWYFPSGFVWTDGSRRGLLYRHPAFSKLCGTSHIVRADLYGLPLDGSAVSEQDIKQRLGSHIFIETMLSQAGTPLAALPFCGAVYRIGHSGAHSGSMGVMRTFVLKRRNFAPLAFVQSVLRLRPMTASVREEFFGPLTFSGRGSS